MDDRPRSALVTGGGSGIGLAIAGALLERGWRVAICGRDAAKLDRAAAELAERGVAADRLSAMSADVSAAAEVKRWVSAAGKRFGPPELLVNNAGIGFQGSIAEMDERQWDATLEVNLKGAMLCTRELLPSLRARGGGWVVNIASIAGKKGFANGSAYCASKFALIGFTECLQREEAAHGIRATAICPGFVATPMVADAEVPAERMIRPEDIAQTVLYLLSLGPTAVIREIVIERLGSL
jgi:3-oxoacyl-[acyl-carrier protein] reductase